MSVLRPLDRLPGLNTATVLLVGTEDALLQQLADSMLKADSTSELKVVNRPRIDLIVFVVNLHSKHSLQSVEESLCHLDAAFFLGKVAFLATGVLRDSIMATGEITVANLGDFPGPRVAGRDSHCSIHRNTVVKLAHTYRSPLLFCDLEIEDFRTAMAQRLVRLLQICAGHVPGVSALNLLSLLRGSENPSLEDL